jgi:hypothetical protein
MRMVQKRRNPQKDEPSLVPWMERRPFGGREFVDPEKLLRLLAPQASLPAS